MEPGKIVLGQIGYGYWGKKLFASFGRHMRFEVAKIAVRNLERGRKFPENVPVTSSVVELLCDPQIKAVIIATPPSSHYALAKQVLESGRHVFVEKIFTERPEQGYELKEIAEQRGLKILVDYTFTFSAAIAQMRELIKKGEIGEIAAIHLSMRQLGRFIGDDVYRLLGSHMLSILNLLIPLGELDFQRQNLLCRDGVVESGTVFFVGKRRPVNGLITLSLNHPEKERRVVVYGERGTLIYDMLAAAPLCLVPYSVAPGKTTLPRDICKQEFTGFSEDNNLAFAAEYFYALLGNLKPSNVEDAILISQVLEEINAVELSRRI